MNTAIDEFSVICLCAEWCGTCRDYRTGFEDIATQFPAARFSWLDIEEQAAHLGDLDVENFPTLVIRRQDLVLYYDIMLPYPGHLARTLQVFVGQTPAQSREYVLADPKRREWQENDDLRRLGAFLNNAE